MNAKRLIEESLISKEFDIPAGTNETLFSVDLPQNLSWQFVFQEIGGTGGIGSLNIQYNTKIATVQNDVSFGRFGGDIITGSGSCIIKANVESFGSVKLNAFFTSQSFSIDPGFLQLSESFATPTGSFVKFPSKYKGFTPFPFNSFIIYSNSQFDLRFRNGANETTYERLGITNQFFGSMSPFPPQNYLQIKTLSPTQIVNIVYSRKD